MRPQAFLVEMGDFMKGIVSAAMGVAGEVIQRLEFAEDRDIDRGAEGLLQFVERGDLASQEQRAQFIGAEGERPHNVIVPVNTDPYVRNYNKFTRALPLPVERAEQAYPSEVQVILKLLSSEAKRRVCYEIETT